MFFFAGVVFRPPALATGTYSDGFWRGAALDCCCPRTHRRLSDDCDYKLLHDGAVQPPQIPKTTTPARCSIGISVFPRFPKTKKAQQGLRTASGVVVFGGFGITVNVIAKVQAPAPGSNSAGELLLEESQSP